MLGVMNAQAKPKVSYAEDLAMEVAALAVGGELRSVPDVGVHVRSPGASFYPDVSTEDPNAITNPVILVEVLSESTEAYDRGVLKAPVKALRAALMLPLEA